MITKTAILGVLAAGQMHGYEIKKRIRSLLGPSADINFGSIYYGLKTYVSKGWVDHIRDEPGKASPERSIYRITPQGRRQLKKLLEMSLADSTGPVSPVEVGLAFMSHLPADRAKQILGERYERLKASYEESLEREPPAGEPAHSRFVREYRLYLLGAEVHWMKNLLPMLKGD
ncbi:MAG: PadR family transcriptional regulator [Candidatus Glassbacteria bacterium]|nr:PadR family transcriptional regulator [Candidatus Glassbacteria bacterium]